VWVRFPPLLPDSKVVKQMATLISDKFVISLSWLEAKALLEEIRSIPKENVGQEIAAIAFILSMNDSSEVTNDCQRTIR
jgi:hypothetical protein